MQTIITVEGKPQGKARPRVTRHGAYTPKKTKDYEAKIRAAWRAQTQDYYGERQISVMIFAYFEPPKSAPKAKKARMLAGGIRPTVKPDGDNIAKAICDALNGVAYKDDAQIVMLAVRKSYAPKAFVKVIVCEAGCEGAL